MRILPITGLIIAGLVLAAGGVHYMNKLSFDASLQVPAEVHESFITWLAMNPRDYKTPEEHKYRASVFYKNFLKVRELNNSGLKWTASLNLLADLTKEEYRGKYLTYKEPENVEIPSERLFNGDAMNQEVAPYVNWVERGAVNKIEAQGRCGSCWAFVALVSVEGAWKISGRQLEKFSEQQLVDCATESDGCGGGWMEYGYNHIIKAGGVMRRSDYPYLAKENGNCLIEESKFVGKLKDYMYIPKWDCSTMVKALNINPLAAAIDAGYMEWYQSGVYSVDYCGDKPNHAVSIVGYGDEWKTGQDYWLVRNTFGENWGEGGYIRMDRNAQRSTGLCGICTRTSFALAADK